MITAERLTATVPAEIPKKADFCIDSLTAALWYLRQQGNIEAEIARITKQSAEMIADLQRDAASLKYLYGAQLEAWAKSELDRSNSRRKSLKTLQGTISFRTVPASVRIADPAAALAYAQEKDLPTLNVKTMTVLDADAYKELAVKHKETTGVYLPGIDRTPEHESVTVTFGKTTLEPSTT